MQKPILNIEKIERAIIIAGIVLLPIAFLPYFVSSFETPKLLLIGLVLFLALTLCSIKTIIKSGISLTTTNYDIPVLLLALVYIVAFFTRSPNKVETFFNPGTVSIFIVLAILFSLSNHLFSNKKNLIISGIFISGVLASVISLLATSGALAKIPFLPAFIKDPLFSTFGGKLPEAIFLVSIIPLGVFLLLGERQSIKKVFWGTALAVILLNTALSIYKVLPGKGGSPILPPYSASWSIAIDTIKNSPFFGIGPGNYASAFSRFRPVTYNASSVWNIRFNTSRSFLLTALSEVGIIGFIFLCFLILRVSRFIVKNLKSGPAISLGLLIISFIFFPFYFTSIIIFFLLLSSISTKKEINLNLKTTSNSAFTSRIPAIALSLIAISIVSGVSYFAVRSSLAEYEFTKSINAVSQNDGKSAYDSMVKAIKLSPSTDRYHNSLSQIDIALASSLAQKKNLTDTDKGTITQLIQEAINEAKAGVSLNPLRAGNWENLAIVYQSIMPFAQGADTFAIQTYTQAIAFDPVNPNLRISLGGIYYALGRYDDAISAFQYATLAKPDLANAHYNLSAAYRQKGDIQKAIDEINIVLSLVPKDSSDYNLAKSELDSLQKKLPAATTQQPGTGSLTTPPQAQKQVITPPITLPQEATPPASK